MTDIDISEIVEETQETVKSGLITTIQDFILDNFYDNGFRNTDVKRIYAKLEDLKRGK